MIWDELPRPALLLYAGHVALFLSAGNLKPKERSGQVFRFRI